MAILKIVGWESGHNKLEMIRILQERLVLGEKESEELTEAVSSGKMMSLNIEDDELANTLDQELTAIGVMVKNESE